MLKIGDIIESVKPMSENSPQHGQHLRMKLITPESVAYAKTLIAAGQWRKVDEATMRFWRTQVVIIDAPAGADYVWVIVMGRSCEERVKVYISELPQEVQRRAKPDTILHAKVNVGAKSVEDLRFSEWESK